MCRAHTEHRPHPSACYLQKAFSSNNMGDGPAKKKKTGPPASNADSARITSYFTSCTSKGLPLPETTKSPSPHIEWGAANCARSITPRIPSHTITASADMALAIPIQHLSTFRSRLAMRPRLEPLSMQDALMIMDDLDIQLALRRDTVHYSSTPANGFCTVCVLDAVHRHTTPQPFATPGLVAHILSSLTVIREGARKAHKADIVAAMSRYIAALDVPLPPKSLPHSEWMDESLTMATGRVTNPSFHTWSEHEQGIFPAGWMQLNALIPGSDFQQPTAGASLTFPALFSALTPHCGFAKNHHFLIRYDNNDLLQQLRWLVLNVASSQVATSAPSLAPPDIRPLVCLATNHPPPNDNPLSIRHGNLSLTLPQKQFQRLYSLLTLTNAVDMHDHVRSILDSDQYGRFIQCAILPACNEADSIPADGFCAYHTLWALAHPIAGSSKFRDRRHLRTVMAPICLDVTVQGDLVAAAMARLTKQSNLPRSLWPSLPKVIAWANATQPTCMWATSTVHPMPWLDLTGLPPRTTTAECLLASTWSLSELLSLELIQNHIGLDTNHYFPVTVNSHNWSIAVDTLVSQIADAINSLRTKRRGCPPVPSACVPPSGTGLLHVVGDPTPAASSTPVNTAIMLTPPPRVRGHLARPAVSVQPDQQSTSDPLPPRRVRFAATLDNRETAPTPRPLIHPAFSRFIPSEDTTLQPLSSRPARSSPRRAVSQKGHQRRTFPPDAELYVLTSQAAIKSDLIVIGPSPIPGSTWAAFARTSSQYGDTIGRYTHFRGARPPCVHASDPVASTGEYAMERPYRGSIIRQDPWLVDTCHARFVEEADTFEQVNVDWVTRDKQILLINVSMNGDIEQGDLYLTNYGEEYWCNVHHPLSLLTLMFRKYSPVMSTQRRQDWKTLLQRVTQREQTLRQISTPSALRRGSKSTQLPPIQNVPAYPRSITHHMVKGASNRADRESPSRMLPLTACQAATRQRLRTARKNAHRKAVTLGTVAAKRTTPTHRAVFPQAQYALSNCFTSITWSPPPSVSDQANRTLMITELLDTYRPDVLWIMLSTEAQCANLHASPQYDTLTFTHPLLTSSTPIWPVAMVLRTWRLSGKNILPLHFPHLPLQNGSCPFDSTPVAPPMVSGFTIQSHPIPGAGPSLPTNPSPDEPLWGPDWTYTFTHTQEPVSPASSLSIMHWPCRGSLYCPGQYVSSEVRHTISFITRIMLARNIDIMWVSDAHILVGMLDPYLPDIHRDLPDCRVLQFPTTRVATSSYNKSNECMGGALAIVTAAWKGFITSTQTDPIGLGILNSIEFSIHGFKFSTACYYFPPYTPGTGAATIHTRVTKYQQSPKAPSWARRMTSHEFIRSLAQQQQSRATELGILRLVCGDFNADTDGSNAAANALNAWCNTCNLIDPARNTKHRLSGHLTRQANSDKQVDSTLDHHFHSSLVGADTWLTQLGTMNHPDSWRRSDHLPTWLTISLRRFVPPVPVRRPIPTAIRCDIDLQNKKEITQYQTLLSQAVKSLPPKLLRVDHTGRTCATPRSSGRLLAAILRLSVKIVDEPHGMGKATKRRLSRHSAKPRSMIKDGYSPTQQLLHSYAVFYRCIIRKVFSSHRNAHTKHIWNTTTSYSLLSSWYKHWQDQYHDILSTTTLPPQARDLPHPLALRSRPFQTITLAYLRDLIHQIHRHLHGADRLLMRMLCNSAIKKREELRLKGKHAQLIELLSNGGIRNDLDLSTIPCPLSGQIVDPHIVHQHVNSHFTDWYAIPANLDPAGLLLATDLEWTRSLLHYHDTGKPQLLHPSSRIPINLQDGIRRACAIKVSLEVQRQLQEATSRPLAFAEFNQAIDAIHAGSAPGPSEVTANMVKGWPLSVRQLVHAHMNNMWLSKFTPLWMKDKVIKLAPKVQGSSDLTNMRPISLYEVIRKIWTTTIARRIHLVWHTNNVLNPTQYGYRLDQGTHMALLNVLNIIEGAHADRVPTAVTFWDIRRAFDSIPRTLQQLAWERLGVSCEIAQWFVQLDEGGLSFMETPLYQSTKSLKRPDELLMQDGHMSRTPQLAIVPQRGVGQGESASSLLWTAVYDMLLDWIDPCNMSLHHFEKLQLQIPFTHQEAKLASATAYADDLATTSRGPKAMILQQTLSTWLSAFGAFSGLTLHPQKIIPVTINSPSLHKTQSLAVRDHQWKTISVPVLHRLDTHKYLGIQLNLQGNYTPSLSLVLRDTKARLQHLLVQPASPQAKMLYIRAKMVPIVLYTACCMDWPLAAYHQLDAVFIHAYRRILSLPERTPNAMYHLPPQLCGIGLPCIADLAQIRKWHVFQRCSAIGGAPASSVHDIFARIPGGLKPFDEWTVAASAPIDTGWPNRPTYMARSLIEWMQQNDLCCAKRSDNLPTQREGQLLSTLAKDLQLWFDPEYYLAEDYAHYPLTAVTTDGAYKVSAATHEDILVSHSSLQDRATGGGGIVLSVNPKLTTQPPLGIHILMDRPERGMTAYTWELLTQLVALHFIKEYPTSLPIRSDCMSAIARTNHALTSHNDTLSTTKAGLLPTCMHQFASHHSPRTVTHIPAHPENDAQRRDNPTDDDMAIFLADAVADGHNNITHVTLGPRQLSFQPCTILLRHIFHELIPPGTWHIRHINGSRSPVLGDLMAYQHSTRLRQYTTTRDAFSGGTYWTDTSYALTHVLHPPVANTPWHRARRNVLVFDKLGHGANRAKLQSLSPAQALATAACTHCGMPDSQEHCMLQCPYAAFTPIRAKARTAQDRVAYDLTQEHAKNILIHRYIRAISHYSWSPSSPYIRRLWLGTWSTQLYQVLIAPTPITAPCSMDERATMISIAAAMTAPLLTAYRGITAHFTLVASPPKFAIPPPVPDEPMPLLDHLPADNHKGGEEQHLMAALLLPPQVKRLQGAAHRYHSFSHVQPVDTSTPLLTLTPDDDDTHAHIADDTHNHDASLYLHNRLFPDDGRLYDDS